MAILPTLSIARSALLVNQAALAVAGRNVANANTPGYTRQVVALGASPLGGVQITAVTRVLDPFLVRRLVAAETDRRHDGTLRDQLAALADVLNEVDGPAIGSALTAFFDAAAALERNPGGLAERQAVLARATTLAAQLDGRSTAVAGLERAADDRYAAVAARADEDLRRLADLDRAIVQSEGGGVPAGELRDQRQQVLGDLAGMLAVTATEDAHGTLTVTAANGTVLVAGGAVFHSILVREAGIGRDGRPLQQAGLADSTGGFLAVPAAFARGELAALTTARDRIAGAAAALDTFARALRDEVNAIQTDSAARDRDGNPTANAPVFSGTGAGDLRVVLDDPARLAAALSGEPGDNRNASRLAALRTATVAGLDGTFTAWLAARQAGLGEDVNQIADRAAASEALFQQLENQRASLSGVNVDEEMTNLLAYQRAFEAASKMIQIADDMLADLLEVLG